MSGISDYSSLVMEACEYSGRNDIMHHFPRFIGFAEAKLNRSLRVADMEASATITLSAGNAPLPDDFLEARQVTAPNGFSISAWSLPALNDQFRHFGGMPRGYAIVGNVIQARPVSDGDLVMSYYAKIPPLGPSAQVNWLLTKAPDVYLYGLLEEIGIWQKDAEAASSVSAMKDAAIRDMKKNDQAARWGNGEVSLGMYTP